MEVIIYRCGDLSYTMLVYWVLGDIESMVSSDKIDLDCLSTFLYFTEMIEWMRNLWHFYSKGKQLGLIKIFLINFLFTNTTTFNVIAITWLTFQLPMLYLFGP